MTLTENAREFMVQLPEAMANMMAEFIPSVIPFNHGFKTLSGLKTFFDYGMKHHGRSKRIPMKVDPLVDKWVEMMKRVCRAHNKDDMDQLDYDMDEIYAPLMLCPVKQFREFCEKFAARLAADLEIPWVVWRVFAAWNRNELAEAKDYSIVKLRTELAQRIAERVKDDVQADVVDAIVGALKWRDEGDLKEIDEALDQGAKPRIKGKESCLFLEVHKGKKVQRRVML